MRKSTFCATLVALATVTGAQADTIKIGFVTTLTTPAGVIGRDIVDAVNLSVEHVGGMIAGKKIEVVFEDDGLKPDLGRQKVEKLLSQDKVDVVSGFIWSNVLLAARKPVMDAGKLLISTNAGPSEIAGRLCHENFFATRVQNDLIPMAMGKTLNARNIKKLYLIGPNYAAGRDVIQGVQRTYNGQTVGVDFTKWGDDPQLDFSAELAKAKASGAEAIFAFFPGRAGNAFVRQFAQAGLDKDMKLFSVYTLDQLALPALQAAAVNAALGAEVTDYWAADLDNPANKRFVEDFRKKYGRIPSAFAASSYDLVPYLKAAIEQSGGDMKNIEKVREALKKADYSSVRGAYRIGRNGFPIDRFYRQVVVADASGPWTLSSKEVVMENVEDPHIGDCKLGR